MRGVLEASEVMTFVLCCATIRLMNWLLRCILQYCALMSSLFIIFYVLSWFSLALAFLLIEYLVSSNNLLLASDTTKMFTIFAYKMT